MKAETELATARQQTDQLQLQISDAQAAKTEAGQQRDDTLAEVAGAPVMISLPHSSQSMRPKLNKLMPKTDWPTGSD